jgi:hypothetical protein
LVERTIRSVAKELASVFYTEAGGDLFGVRPEDRARSRRFRETYPTLRHYLRGLQVTTSGAVKQGEAGWLHFVDAARKRLIQMLGDPQHKNMHEAIYKSICEDNVKSTSPHAKSLLQRRMNNQTVIS